MNDALDVTDRNAVVVGAARSGIAAARLLARRGARVTLTDLRSDVPEAAGLEREGVTMRFGAHAENEVLAAQLIVLSPGVPAHLPMLERARAAGIPVIGELELASRWLPGRIVAITGTKGKSTTTSLTGRILAAGGIRALVGGNIGEALSIQVDASGSDAVHVVEVSSFQLETIVTFHPWIAVFLNFSPDHLDRHASVEEYGAAKARIFENQTPDDWAVINADDPQVLELARRARARQLRFALETRLSEGIVVANGSIAHRTADGEVPLVPLSAVKLLGRHLLNDVLAAAAVGRLAGVAPNAMTMAVASFTGLEHALEPVAEVDGVRYVNDSKATNVEAARRAIESFDRGLVVIMGGRFKGGDLTTLAGPLAERAVAVVAIGESRRLMREAFGDVVAIHEAETFPDAIRMARRLAPSGGTVLLAPACASFDMFRDYAERGRLFKEEVRKMEAGEQ